MKMVSLICGPRNVQTLSRRRNKVQHIQIEEPLKELLNLKELKRTS